MKKLFSFIMVALMSIMTLNAETMRIYCKMSQGWWTEAGAAVGCHSWGTGSGTNWPGVRMTPVENETDLWYIDLDIDQVQNVIFTRVNPSGAIEDWGAKTKDLQIPANGDDLFTITTTEAVWGDPGCEGTWSKYEVPVPTEPAVTKIEIEGDMSVAGSELTFWVTVAGFSAEPMVTFEVKAGEGEYEQLQRNKFTPTANGNYTVKATAIYRSDEKGIYEEAFKEVNFTIGTPAAGITVNVTVPAGTPACYFYGEMSNNLFVKMDKVDDTHYTTEFPEATTIGWGYLFAWEKDNWNTKNADPEGDIKVEPVNGVIDVEVKAWTTAPQPIEVKYYAKNNWDKAAEWSWLEMSATNQENVYMLDSVVFGGTGVNINTKTEDADALWFAADEITVLDGLDGFPAPIPPDPRKRDTLIWAPARTNAPLEAPQLQAGDTIKLFFNAVDSKLRAAIVGRPEQPQPVGTFDLTIVQDTVWSKDNAKVAAWIWADDLAGQWTSWATNTNDTLTLKVDERADSIILVRNSPEATEPTWEAWNRIDAGEINDCHLFIITNWNEGVWCERPQPVGEKYYITGNAALVGDKAWDAQAIEMTDGAYTFTELAAGDYEMKITNGAWEPEGQSWGSAALSEECSAGVGDKDGNIHFVVETPNDVTISIAEGKVTVTGTFKEEPVGTGITVNVTVPVGTPACYFYGEMSGNLFAEMTKLDDTHYTITFPHATTIGWGYLFVWENGNWNTKNADPEGDIKVEPVEGVIDIEIKAWVTNPGTEYKYTTYTEWQVKFGPTWEWVNMTKQEDGTFTVEAVWGNTGINIASGENPIKQDWYPLDDAALTVAEDVVEGDNVVITLTVVNDETVALHVAKGQGPTPVDDGYGILLNGTDYIKGEASEIVGGKEYKVVLDLNIGDFVQLYDGTNHVAWVVDPEGAGYTNFDKHDNALYIKENGNYQFYVKIFTDANSGLYVGFTSDPTGLIEIMRNAKDGKFIINGKMIIRRNGALYTIQGARL